MGLQVFKLFYNICIRLHYVYVVKVFSFLLWNWVDMRSGNGTWINRDFYQRPISLISELRVFSRHKLAENKNVSEKIGGCGIQAE